MLDHLWCLIIDNFYIDPHVASTSFIDTNCLILLSSQPESKTASHIVSGGDSEPTDNQVKPPSDRDTNFIATKQSSSGTKLQLQSTDPSSTNFDHSEEASSQKKEEGIPVDGEYGTPVDARVNGNNNNNAFGSATSGTEAVSPYVAQVLANMPPAVQAPEDESTRHLDSEEWQRRAAWREGKRDALEKEFHRIESMIKETKAAQESASKESNVD